MRIKLTRQAVPLLSHASCEAEIQTRARWRRRRAWWAAQTPPLHLSSRLLGASPPAALCTSPCLPLFHLHLQSAWRQSATVHLQFTLYQSCSQATFPRQVVHRQVPYAHVRTRKNWLQTIKLCPAEYADIFWHQFQTINHIFELRSAHGQRLRRTCGTRRTWPRTRRARRSTCPGAVPIRDTLRERERERERERHTEIHRDT